METSSSLDNDSHHSSSERRLPLPPPSLLTSFVDHDSRSSETNSFLSSSQSKICSLTIDFFEKYLNLKQSSFIQLNKLDLHLRNGRYGKIKYIENLHQFPNLIQLNLSYNSIQLMNGLQSLQRLIELNLSENFILKIENIFHLSSLERLNLCGNQIERIPSNIQQLKCLNILRLNRNKVWILFLPSDLFVLFFSSLASSH
jgi:Leucine-rich repeat (LRR) protein